MFPRAVISELGAVIRNVEIGLFIPHGYLGKNSNSFGYGRDSPITSARCKRSSLEPGATPQV